MKLTMRDKDNRCYTHDILTEIITIGRSSSNDFVIPLDDLSRKHCVVTVKNGFFFIKDLGSKNGVKVDSRSLTPLVQYSIYADSIILIANFFQLILPGGEFLKNELATKEIRLINPTLK
jgi:pSer/pThr/pTyr-binding forkhead associated (FHA) protein